MNDVNGDALRLAALERENAKLKKINAALMRRVEQGLADNGNSFTFFQVAVELEHRIQERTRALEQAMAELEAANLMAFKAAALYDAGRDCGAEANAAKYLGAEAGFHACETAIFTHGGMGYAKAYDVERYFRESMIARIAPISREMVFNFIAERVLGLTKSY